MFQKNNDILIRHRWNSWRYKTGFACSHYRL